MISKSFEGKKILITGGALGDIPIIKSAKDLGLFVITSGDNHSDIGHALSDKYIESDYVDSDSIESICCDESIDYLFSSCHDLAYIAASVVAEKLNYAGFDSSQTAKVIHNKHLLRTHLKNISVATPRFSTCNSQDQAMQAANELTFPVIVKPVDMTGGNGVSICEDKSYLQRAFERAFSVSRKNLVIIEEFLRGTYHCLSAFISQGEIIHRFVDDEYYIPGAFRVSGTSYPTTVNEKVIDELSLDLKALMQSLSLVDGLLHVQFISTSTGPVIIEIMRRTPGDLYPNFVEYAIGINHAHNILKPYLSDPYSSTDFIERHEGQGQKYTYLRYMLMSKSRGTISNYEISKIEGLKEIFYIRQIGSFVDNPRKDTCAIIFLESDNSKKPPFFLYEHVKNSSKVFLDVI